MDDVPRARPRIPLGAIYFVLINAFLYLPLLLLLIFSFNDSTNLIFPLQGFTLRWYADLWRTPELLGALRNSLVLGISSSMVATLLGTMAAIGIVRFRFPGRNLFLAIAAMPLVIPTVVLAVAILIGTVQLGIPLSLWTVGVSHVVISLPVVILIVAARLLGLSRTLEEAAMDLGTSFWGAQWRVTLPLAFPAIVAAFLTAFTTSFDEFALTFFLIGPEPTLPIYLYSQLRFPRRLPLVVAVASLIVVGSILMILLVEWLRQLGQTPPPAEEEEYESSRSTVRPKQSLLSRP